MGYILDNVTDSSLVIIDELGELGDSHVVTHFEFVIAASGG